MIKIILINLLLTSVLFGQTYSLSGPSKGTTQKIAKRILTKAYNKAGFSVEFVNNSLSVSLVETNKGLYDGETLRVKGIDKKYSNLIMVPVPIFSIDAAVFSKDKNLKIQSFNDLKGKKFGIVKGVKFIEKATQNYKKIYKTNMQDAIESLASGEIDILVFPNFAATAIVYNKKYKDIYRVTKSLKSLKLYHYVHKKNVDLVPILTSVLQEMKDKKEFLYIKNSVLQSIVNHKNK
ncbi:transporter substrate-binding domain-containing protein [Sulfurimonas sp. SAG-AH-194-C21]|nr:transporter substrate-binding domain-containing protein [Sulfurimonas sp. SAG-AH-194-C21]MDF1882657.1 transporter substrate-binding domain-containing protein [Sulfurimonas sp. SAG-AH-194-C21]